MNTIPQLVEEYLSSLTNYTSQYDLSRMLSDLVYALDQEGLIDNGITYDKIICKKIVISSDESILQLDKLAFFSAYAFDIKHITLYNYSESEQAIAFIGMLTNVAASIQVFNKLRGLISNLKTYFIETRTKRMKPENKLKRSKDFIDNWISKLQVELGYCSYEIKLLDKYIKENFHTIDDLYESMRIPVDIAKLVSDKKNAKKTIEEVVYGKYSRELIYEVKDKMDLLHKEDLILFPYKTHGDGDDYI